MDAARRYLGNLVTFKAEIIMHTDPLLVKKLKMLLVLYNFDLEGLNEVPILLLVDPTNCLASSGCHHLCLRSS